MVCYRLLTALILGLLRMRFLAPAVFGLPVSAPCREWLLPPDNRRDGGRDDGPLIWFHGASNGELTSARAVLETLLGRAPDLRLLVTTNTVSARRMVMQWNLPRTSVRIAPFDNRALVAAFLARLRPAALIMIESELWPNRLIRCAEINLPVLVLGARMSARSAGLWGRFPGLTRKLFGAVRYLSAQDLLSEARFCDLGLAADKIGPLVNLKSAAAPTTPGQVLWPHPRSETLLAASTHAGEDAIVLDAFVSARRSRPGLHVILAPRHPRRRAEIEAQMTRRGLGFATRSRGQQPDVASPVYLADTLGEMGLWYAAAGLCFVGGSLTDNGGHTPFEPAACGAVILHGPHVANFAAAYAALTRAGAACAVTDAATLAQAIQALADPSRQSSLAQAARAALLPLQDAGGLDGFYRALAVATGLKFPAI